MDIIREIFSLPNYYYEFSDPPTFAILGGHSCRKVDQYDGVTICIARRWFTKMNILFEKDNMEVEDKKVIAQLASKIGNNCNERMESLYTRQQQEDFINSLSQEAKSEIEQQIKRYKTAREYYQLYVH